MTKERRDAVSKWIAIGVAGASLIFSTLLGLPKCTELQTTQAAAERLDAVKVEISGRVGALEKRNDETHRHMLEAIKTNQEELKSVRKEQSETYKEISRELRRILGRLPRTP